MAGEVVVSKVQLGPRPSYLPGPPREEDYGNFSVPAGAPIAVLSTDDKRWTIKYKALPDGKITLQRDGVPQPHVDIIVIDANEHITKAFYLDGYDRKKPAQRPDCASLDGIVPLAGVPNKQNTICKTCRWDQFGSAKVGGGKACQDNKRIAVVPQSNPDNPNFGGPMLLKLPPTSFPKFAEFITECKRNHVLPHEVVTRISFSPDYQYQVVMFDILQYVPEAVEPIIKKWLTDPHTARVLQSVPEELEDAIKAAAETATATQLPDPEPVQTRETATIAAATAERVAAATVANGITDPFAASPNVQPIGAPVAAGGSSGGDPFGSGSVPATAPAIQPVAAVVPDPIEDRKAQIAELKRKRLEAMEQAAAELEALETEEGALAATPAIVETPTVPSTLGTADDVLSMIDAEVGGPSIPG